MSNASRLRHLCLGSLVFSLALPAAAHPGLHHATGFLNGLSHPFSGLDHLLAMLAIGLFAARQRGNARFALPVFFVAMMGLGSLLTLSGLALPGLEATLAVSVLVLGLMVAATRPLPLALSTSLIGLFALAHGAAHGLERTAGAPFLPYAMGFLLATATLHASAWVLASRLLPNIHTQRLLRTSGLFIAFASVPLLGGLI